MNLHQTTVKLDKAKISPDLKLSCYTVLDVAQDLGVGDAEFHSNESDDVTLRISGLLWGLTYQINTEGYIVIQADRCARGWYIKADQLRQVTYLLVNLMRKIASKVYKSKWKETVCETGMHMDAAKIRILRNDTPCNYGKFINS